MIYVPQRGNQIYVDINIFKKGKSILNLELQNILSQMNSYIIIKYMWMQYFSLYAEAHAEWWSWRMDIAILDNNIVNSLFF